MTIHKPMAAVMVGFQFLCTSLLALPREATESILCPKMVITWALIGATMMEGKEKMVITVAMGVLLSRGMPKGKPPRLCHL